MITEKLTAYLRSPKHEQLKGWTKLLTLSGAAQIIVQAIGLLSGIIIIRILPTKEYALYTLVNTMLGTMAILTDGGIGSGVMAEGGKVWQNKAQLSKVIITGLNLRKKFAAFSLLVSIPILFFLLIHHGANWFEATLIVVCLIPAFTATIYDSLMEIGLKLKQDIISLQKNQVWVSIIRAILVTPLFLFPFSFAAIILAGIARIVGNIKLKQILSRHVDWNQGNDNEIKIQILSSVKKILPGAIYYCISGQLTIWLISIFGNTTSIAQIGALSRLTVILTIISTIFNTIIVPRFARLVNQRKILLMKLIQIVIAISFSLIFVISVVSSFPSLFLLILGNKYSGISSELLLSVIGSSLGLFTAVIYSLSTSRGWLLNPLFYIPVNIASVVLSILIFDVSTVNGILMVNIATTTVQVVMNITYCLFRIFKTPL